MSDFDTRNDDDGDYHDDIFTMNINKPIGSIAYMKDAYGDIIEYEKTECGWLAQ